MSSESKIKGVSLGGSYYLSQQDLLDFLSKRGTLVAEELRVRGTPLGDTEFLRGQSFELEILKHAILPPAQSS